MVAHPGGDLGAGGEGIDPAQAVLPDRAPVPTEELDHAGLARRHHVEPAHREEGRQGDHDASDDQHGLPAGRVDRRGGDDEAGADEQPDQPEEQGEPAADAVRLGLADPWRRHLGHIGGDLRGIVRGHGWSPVLSLLTK